MTTVIHVKGIQGSGKTWLCKRLGSICYDLDDIVTLAYKQFGKVSSKRDVNRIFKMGINNVKQIIKKHRSEGLPVVFAGITLKVPDPDYLYFVKLSEKELEDAYRRTIKREMHKIIDNHEALECIVNKRPVKDIAYRLSLTYHIGALDITTTFEGYKKMYRQALSFEKQQDAKIMSQERVLSEIKTILK